MGNDTYVLCSTARLKHGRTPCVWPRYVFFIKRLVYQNTLNTASILLAHPPPQTAHCSEGTAESPLLPDSPFHIQLFQTGLAVQEQWATSYGFSKALYLSVPSSRPIAFRAPTSRQQSQAGAGRHPAVTVHWRPMLLPEFPARQPELQSQPLPRLSKRGGIFAHWVKPAPLGSSPAGQLLLQRKTHWQARLLPHQQRGSSWDREPDSCGVCPACGTSPAFPLESNDPAACWQAACPAECGCWRCSLAGMPGDRHALPTAVTFLLSVQHSSEISVTSTAVVQEHVALASTNAF